MHVCMYVCVSKLLVVVLGFQEAPTSAWRNMTLTSHASAAAAFPERLAAPSHRDKSLPKTPRAGASRNLGLQGPHIPKGHGGLPDGRDDHAAAARRRMTTGHARQCKHCHFNPMYIHVFVCVYKYIDVCISIYIYMYNYIL